MLDLVGVMVDLMFNQLELKKKSTARLVGQHFNRTIIFLAFHSLIVSDDIRIAVVVFADIRFLFSEAWISRASD